VEQGRPFDLCLCDIQMPDMDGYELAKEIRSSKSKIQNIPLIALSSLMVRNSKECKSAGFNGFLSKPIHREKLFQMMKRILGEEHNRAKGTELEAEGPIVTQYSVREEMKHSVHILLAEDNSVNQKLAKIMLGKAGYQIEIANNGREAVEKYTTSPRDFDLIFMDIQMPEMDGWEATQEIRNWENRVYKTEGKKIRVPIIAMTAHAMKGDQERCLAAGMDDYVSKPIKRELVFNVIEKWVLREKKI
jgi:two-component system sensor histidine kinase/response regulator